MDIDITLKNYRCFEDSSLARITVGRSFVGFVGPNNSGKSSVLRFFYEFRELLRLLAQGSSGNAQALDNRPQGFNFRGLLDSNEVFCKFNDRGLEIILEPHIPRTTVDSSEGPSMPRIVAKILRGTSAYTLHVEIDGKPVDTTGGNFEGSVFHSDNINIDLSDFFEAIRPLSSTVYIPAFRNIINVGSNDSYYDINVGQAFVTAWHNLKTGDNRKENEAAAEVTNLIRRIFDYDSLELNASANGQSIIAMIDGKAYGLHEQGSGFAQFVLCLINAAIKQPSFILIDEPELGLHASLQLQFLTTLGTFATQGVLFATHSMGLARSAGEFVYSLRRQSNGKGEIHELGSEPRLSELLGELNFSGYRELGYAGILLVEGATDIKLVHEFFRKFGMDHHVVVLSLGGGQLIRDGVEAEIEEIKRISEKIYALIDSEKAASEDPLESNREGFVELCDRVGVHCHVLERRAIENYLSDDAVKHIFGDKYRALEPYELLRDLELGWAKSDNWRIARVMRAEEISDTDLGQFLLVIKDS